MHLSRPSESSVTGADAVSGEGSIPMSLEKPEVAESAVDDGKMREEDLIDKTGSILC